MSKYIIYSLGIFIVAFIAIKFSFCAVSAGNANEKIKLGDDIRKAVIALGGYGDGSPMLEMDSGNKNSDLKMWSISPGILILVYDKDSGKIISMVFHLSDSGLKKFRTEFDLKVIEYDFVNFNMKINLDGKANVKP